MTLKSFYIESECRPLRQVIIGSETNFHQNEAYVEKINQKQSTLGVPAIEELESQLKEFKQALIKQQVEVFQPSYIAPFVPDQLTPRDIGFVIGEKFILGNMASKSRRYESFGIMHILRDFDLSDYSVLIPPHFSTIEGGDVIVDRNCVFVGQSNRTNREGFQFIKEHFSDQFSVIPVSLMDTPDTRFLHLDCVFNPVGDKHAFIYKEGIQKLPAEIQHNYELIELSDDEQNELAANVLTLSPDLVITRKSKKLERVNRILRQFYETIEINFDAIVMTGGSFRCASLPLIRNID